MKTPVWVTVLVAALVLLGTLFTAWQAREAAKASAEAAKEAATASAQASTSAAEISAAASRFGVRSDRFATWQMHKRKVYSELLVSIREAREQPDGDCLRRMWRCFDEAVIVADDVLLEMLYGLRGQLPPDRERRPFFVSAEWRELVWAMKQDVERPDDRRYPESEEE